MTEITHLPSGRLVVDSIPVVFHASACRPAAIMPGGIACFGDFHNLWDVLQSRERRDLYVPGWPNEAAVAAHWRMVMVAAVQSAKL